MSIEQYKQQYAEFAELDKQRTQGEWVAEHDDLEPELPYSCVMTGKDYITTSDFETGICLTPSDANFIAQAPAMFKMIGELIARVEALEKEITFKDELDWEEHLKDMQNPTYPYGQK